MSVKAISAEYIPKVDEISNTILGIYKGYLDASYGVNIQVSVAERR